MRNLLSIVILFSFFTTDYCKAQTLPKEVKGFSQEYKAKMKEIFSSVNFNTEKTLSTKQMSQIQKDVLEMKDVNINEQVESIFDPQNHPCSFDKKVKEKLLDNENKKKKHKQWNGWTPEFVNTSIKSLLQGDSVVSYSPGESLTYRLHTVTFKKKNTGAESSTLLYNCPTYKAFDYQKFMLTEGRTNFLYTLDCSGYLNAAIDVSGGLPVAEMNMAAHSALTTKNSMFVAGGIVASPLTIAYTGQIKLDTSLRIEILQSILEIPDIADDDIVYLDLVYGAIWASTTGQSSFNSGIDLNTKAGGTIGFAQASGDTHTGGSVTRNSSFTNYTTYLRKDKAFFVPQDITIAKIKTLIKSLKKDAQKAQLENNLVKELGK